MKSFRNGLQFASDAHLALVFSIELRLTLLELPTKFGGYFDTQSVSNLQYRRLTDNLISGFNLKLSRSEALERATGGRKWFRRAACRPDACLYLKRRQIDITAGGEHTWCKKLFFARVPSSFYGFHVSLINVIRRGSRNSLCRESKPHFFLRYPIYQVPQMGQSPPKNTVPNYLMLEKKLSHVVS